LQNIEAETGDANLVGDFTSALKTYNLKKNRYKNILPCELLIHIFDIIVEKTRVTLKAIPTVEGSDFISANWISVRKLEKFSNF
jgi:protein tyrosine phosphatase